MRRASWRTTVPRAIDSLSPYWQHGAHRLYHGDCIGLMACLPACSVDLCFADPPFNVGYVYDVYNDSRPDEEYFAWTGKWVGGVYRVLKEGGAFWLAIGAARQAHVRLCVEMLGFTWMDTIIWHYTFGPRQTTKLTPSWVALHYFIKPGATHTWNHQSIQVPSARQLKYNDRRAVPGGKNPDNVWALLPGEEDRLFNPHGNAWLQSRVCGTFKERTGHPCQMPQPLLERIINLCSNPGDVVLDPFAGSGTTPAACIRLSRVAVGVELSEEYCRAMAGRLDTAVGEDNDGLHD